MKTNPLRTPPRWWAAASGGTGLIANAFLVLFYLTAQPWTGNAGDGWFGAANDVLVLIQYLALVPVVLGLGRLMDGDTRARVWTGIGLVAAVAVIVLQALLITGAMPFERQVVAVSLSAVLTMCWAGAISAAGTRTRTLPRTVTRLGRVVVIGLPIALGTFGIGALVTAVSGVSWAWAAGGIPGFVVWTLFPAWTLLLATAPSRPRDRPTADPGRR
ncbi:hypothetical protein [Nonomuraea sp. NPDC049784]|uniref:hypothetical protein n=1 Tax=Nonomuraea sp. NPDC049784 TaxID=3154361 RepID=UPI0033FFF13A